MERALGDDAGPIAVSVGHETCISLVAGIVEIPSKKGGEVISIEFMWAVLLGPRAKHAPVRIQIGLGDERCGQISIQKEAWSGRIVVVPRIVGANSFGNSLTQDIEIFMSAKTASAIGIDIGEESLEDRVTAAVSQLPGIQI